MTQAEMSVEIRKILEDMPEEYPTQEELDDIYDCFIKSAPRGILRDRINAE